MMRRVMLVMTIGAIGLLTVVVPARAQAQESPSVTTSSSVLGSSTSVQGDTTTTVLGTSTTAGETTTTGAGVIAATTTTTETPIVAGVTSRRLPLTGGDVSGTAVVGLALTGAGIALAVGARRRRAHAESA